MVVGGEGISVNFSVAWQKIQGMINGFIALLPSLVIAVALFGLMYFLGRYVRIAVRRLVERSDSARPHNLALVLGRIAQWVIVLTGLLIALSIVVPSFQPGDLITLLGVSSVAIGFAFRDVFQNFLSGILILMTRPFRIGDIISVNGQEGYVQEIETRATTIRTYDYRRIVIPNTTLFTNSVTVITAYDRRRFEYEFGIGNDSDSELAKKIAVEVARSTRGVLQEPAPGAYVMGLGEYAVNIRLLWWTRPDPAVFEVTDAILSGLKARFDDAGIDLPYPTRAILLTNETPMRDDADFERREREDARIAAARRDRQ